MIYKANDNMISKTNEHLKYVHVSASICLYKKVQLRNVIRRHDIQ